jgi:N-acetylmuramoyl-L-alanine amidase
MRTEEARYVQARWYDTRTPDFPPLPDWVVIHTTEGGSAYGNAVYCSYRSDPVSAHVFSDASENVGGVDTTDEAYGALYVPNGRGLQVEIAGWSSWSWDQPEQIGAMRNAARWVAARMRELKMTPRWLTPAEIRDGAGRGMLTHADCTLYRNDGNTHTDPGPRFPREAFVAMVRQFMAPAPEPLSYVEDHGMDVVMLGENRDHPWAFIRGTNDRLHAYDPHEGAWHSIGPYGMTTGPGACSVDGKRVDLFFGHGAPGSDLLHIWNLDVEADLQTGGWQGESLGGRVSGTPGVETTGGGGIMVVVRGVPWATETFCGIYSNRYEASAPGAFMWSGWHRVGPVGTFAK